MRPTSVSRALALSLGLCFAATAGAQTGTPGGNGVQASGGKVPSLAPNGSPTVPQTSQAPNGGRTFGQHVSGMAPEHPIEHGRHFGECVSTMAQGGAMCEHDDDEMMP